MRYQYVLKSLLSSYPTQRHAENFGGKANENSGRNGSALEVVLHDYALYKSTFTLLERRGKSWVSFKIGCKLYSTRLFEPFQP